MDKSNVMLFKLEINDMLDQNHIYPLLKKHLFLLDMIELLTEKK